MGAVAFYIIGLPASGYLALGTSFQLLGIWLGNALGMTTAAVAMAFRIMWVNWEKVVKSSSGESADLTESLRQNSFPAEGGSLPQGSIRLEARAVVVGIILVVGC